MSERFFDNLARTLASPMPRRRALKLTGVALVAATLPVLRPRSVSAADIPECSNPLYPQRCVTPNVTESGTAAFACVGAKDHCCSNKLCAGACKPWEMCSPGAGCDDTPALCTNPDVPNHDPKRTKFCSQRLAAGKTFCYPGGRTLTYGWCCEADQPCGDFRSRCTCPTMCQDGTCCPRSKGRCVNGKCCPAIRTTFRPGSGKKAVACCPPGTVAVPGGVGLCCPKGKPKCCDKYDPRADDSDTATLGPSKGMLCVNGKQRSG